MPAPTPAYTQSMLDAHGRSVARLERAALCDTLESVGPEADTLCAGWDARHLAAHLVLREGRAGVVASPIPKVGDKAVDLLAGRREYVDLIASIRSGPPSLSFFALPGFDRRFNLLEYYVHHEDVRRATPGWSTRALPDWAEAKLGRALATMAKVTMRRSPVGVVLARTDSGETLEVVPGDAAVTLRGRPSELVLYAFGRRSVADVEVEGDDVAVDSFTRQSFAV